MINYDNLSDDILYLIYTLLNSKKDIYSFRLINTNCNNIFKEEFINLQINNPYIPRIYRKQHICYICNMERVCTSFLYYCDTYPQRILYYCSNINCFWKCIKLFLINIQRDLIFPFFAFNKLDINLQLDNDDTINAKLYKNIILLNKNEFHIMVHIFNYFFIFVTFSDLDNLNSNLSIKKNILFKWILYDDYKNLYNFGERKFHALLK